MTGLWPFVRAGICNLEAGGFLSLISILQLELKLINVVLIGIDIRILLLVRGERGKVSNNFTLVNSKVIDLNNDLAL